MRGKLPFSSFSDSCLCDSFLWVDVPTAWWVPVWYLCPASFPPPGTMSDTFKERKGKKGMKRHESRRVKMIGRLNLGGYCISRSVCLWKGFITGWTTLLQSCFQAAVSCWCVTLFLPCWSFHHSCDRLLARTLQLFGSSPRLPSTHTSLPLHTAIIYSSVQMYITLRKHSAASCIDSSDTPPVREMVKSFSHETRYQSHPEFWRLFFDCLQLL